MEVEEEMEVEVEEEGAFGMAATPPPWSAAGADVTAASASIGVAAWVTASAGGEETVVTLKAAAVVAPARGFKNRECEVSGMAVEVGGGVAVAGGGMCRRPSECEWRSCQRGIATHEAAQRRERVRHRPFLMWKGGGGMRLLYFEVKRNPTETLDYYIIGHTDRQAKT